MKDTSAIELSWYYGCSDATFGFGACDPSVEFIQVSGNSIETQMVGMCDDGSQTERNRRVYTALKKSSGHSQNVLSSCYNVSAGQLERLIDGFIHQKNLEKKNKTSHYGALITLAKKRWKQIQYRQANLLPILGNIASMMQKNNQFEISLEAAKVEFDKCIEEYRSNCIARVPKKLTETLSRTDWGNINFESRSDSGQRRVIHIKHSAEHELPKFEEE